MVYVCAMSVLIFTTWFPPGSSLHSGATGPDLKGEGLTPSSGQDRTDPLGTRFGLGCLIGSFRLAIGRTSIALARL